MGETLNLLFRKCEDGSFELQLKEGRSGHIIRGSFDPPYAPRQLSTILRKLNTFESDDHELREIGWNLYHSLIDSSPYGTDRREASEQSIRAVLRNVIQGALGRRESVALTLSFTPGCHEFVRYPWELLHNSEYFLLASGVFTLTRALVRPDMPSGSDLPVHPPLRVLYIGASPLNNPALEIEASYEALQQGLARLKEENLVILDRLDPPTFDELVRYLNSRGGLGAFDERDISYPCYAIHFDGHGAFRRQCPADMCDELNDIHAGYCRVCGTSLRSVAPQTFLCFQDNEGFSRLIDTETLRELFVRSDVRMAVFAACETAMLTRESRNRSHRQKQAAIDATLATALVTSQVPAVIAMPFSIEDKLSPTFMFHFYEALANGRTLEDALSRARQAMLPLFKHHSWFIPVLYRHVTEGHEGPVAFLSVRDELEEQEQVFAHLHASQSFVGRERELQDLGDLLTQATASEEQRREMKSLHLLRPGMHHIALTGPAGIGKSALAFEAVKRNLENFQGGFVGISLQGGKSFAEALIEIAQRLHIPTHTLHTANTRHCEQVVLDCYRNLANRRLYCILLLDRFDEVQERNVIDAWMRFLCSLPTHVVVLLTSHSNPESLAVLEGVSCHWYEYRVDKMTNEDLLKLFTELSQASGLAERIHLDDAEQQAILEEICRLLDGYPLGAELIFGRAQAINGKVFGPEAATRSLEEVRDELEESQLEGIAAVFDVAYHLLSESARKLLPYLAVFKLPFSHEQIVMLIEQKSASMRWISGSKENERAMKEGSAGNLGNTLFLQGSILPKELQKNWRSARDELVQASFVQFDGRLYHIHSQVRHYAHALLPLEEHKRLHRVAAAYYSHLPHPTADQWFAAFEHLVEVDEPQDLQEAVRLAIKASWDLQDRGRASEMLAMLERAQTLALHLDDKTDEGKIQCCLGAILRQQGHYGSSLACLTRSLALHREQNEPDEAGWALYELAMLFREEGHLKQAGEHAREALELFKKAGDASGEAWMQMVLGEVDRGYGHYQEALEKIEEVLASFHRLNNEEGYAHALFDRSTIYEAFGRYTESLEDSDEALRVFTKLGLRFWQAWVLSEQSVVFLDQGKCDQAERTCNESVAIFREQKALRGEGWALRVLGDIARRRGNTLDASDYYTQSLALFRDVGDRIDQAHVLNSQGANCLAQGQVLEAKEAFEHARAIANGQQAMQLVGRALRGLGDVACIEHRLAEAEHFYNEAAKIAADLHTPAERCAILRRQGELYRNQGKYQEALTTWVHAYAEDLRQGHTDRESLKEKIEELVKSQGLQKFYEELTERFDI
jgi:tetratricopeptide (TPR) repeat protein